MRRPINHARMIESLENRFLLSVAPTPTPVAAPVAPAVIVAPKASIPNMVGTYTGSTTLTIPSMNVNETFKTTWTIKSQTSNHLTGSISIDGLGGTGTFTGTIDSKGNFKYTLPVKVGAIKETMTISGHLSGKTLTGTVTFTRGTTTFLTGTYSYTKK